MFSKTLFPVFSNFATKTLQLNILGVNSNKINAAPNLDIVRHAARKGTRAKALAKKKALKLKLQSKPPPIPKFIQRKVKVSSELQRIRCTDENWLETQPIDNVWNMKLYRGKPFPISEAIKMHQDSHVPAILNDPSALVFANVELDLKLKKKDRFLEDLNGIISFPHKFDTQKKNKIVVVCKTPEDQLKATEAGALFVGSTTLIKQILSGVVSREDFDYLICHPDMYKELNALRGILAKKFPNAHNGLLRLDIDQAVASFINGVEYNLKRSATEPDFGWVDVPFGRLDMSIQALEENLKVILSAVEKNKPPGTDNILFIVRCLLCCQKSREKFKIPHWEYLPSYPLNGVIGDGLEEAEDEAAPDKEETV